MTTSDTSSGQDPHAPAVGAAAGATNGKGTERDSLEARPTTVMAPKHGVVRVRVFGRTEVGLVREHNEDNFLIADLTTFNRSLREEVRTHVVAERGNIFAVCDGMGGAAAGEIASQMAVDTIYEVMQRGEPPPEREEYARRLVHSIEEAGARIFGEAKLDRTRRGMGTTVTAAGIFQHYLFIGQVGDSRAYLLRNGKLTLVTKDQSLVNQLIEAGQLTEEEAEQFEHSNIILQALGTSEQVHVDLTFVELRKGDRLMLCSDGLSGLVHADTLREVMATTPEPIDCCKRLTELANAGGGHDNITVIVADFDGEIPAPGEGEDARYQQYALPPAPNDGVGEDTVTRPLHIKGSGPKPGADVKRMTDGDGDSATWPASSQAAMAGRAYASPEDDEGRGGGRWWILLLLLLVVAGVAGAVYLVAFRGLGIGEPLIHLGGEPVVATPVPVVRPVEMPAPPAQPDPSGPAAGPGVRELPADDLLHAGDPTAQPAGPEAGDPPAAAPTDPQQAPTDPQQAPTDPQQAPTPTEPAAGTAPPTTPAPDPTAAPPGSDTTPIAEPTTVSVLVITDAQDGILVVDGVNRGPFNISRPRRLDLTPGAHTYRLVINRITQAQRRTTCRVGESCRVILNLPQGVVSPPSGRPSGGGTEPRRPPARRPGEPIPPNPF
ncbi:MAG: Stp1/IreP family PP2C-type Ser/Thr phosphatase [Deltaproteobacteria bacterium]|nr:Stp1/IreP family PP2C-type Ser/Thr phosphatase [Deltaproteobacteria bacterium]